MPPIGILGPIGKFSLNHVRIVINRWLEELHAIRMSGPLDDTIFSYVGLTEIKVNQQNLGML